MLPQAHSPPRADQIGKSFHYISRMIRNLLTPGIITIIVLLTQCETPVPHEYNIYEKSIQKKMRAEKCVISFDSANSLGEQKQTIRIEVFNPHEEISASPFWYTSSVTALQYYWDTNGEDFTEYEYIEIKLTQEDSTDGSAQSQADGLPISYVLLADSLYTITLAILQDPGGLGFTKSENSFAGNFTTTRLQLHDSARQKMITSPSQKPTCIPGGFQYLQSGSSNETLIFVYVLEEHPHGTDEHRFVFSKQTRKILDYTVAPL